jgi:aerobic carbon-monoxide dehydrogenase small subunit
LRESIEISVNGSKYGVRVRPYDTLNRILREELGLTGTKRGCDYGGCGSCTVAVDGKPVYSCMYPAQYAEGKEILTVEGLANNGSLSELQNSFLTKGGLQCGYCTPGILISTKCLLDRNPEPTLSDIQEAIAGNICRCTGYGRVIESILSASKSMRENSRK